MESDWAYPAASENGTHRLHQSMARYQGDATKDQTCSFANGPEAEVVIELDSGFGGMSAMFKPRLILPARAQETAY